jgi:hypothetical protein
MTVTFKSNDGATAAYQAWKDVKLLTLLVDHNMHCDGNKVSGYEVLQFRLQGKTLTMQVELISLGHVIKDYNVRITKYDMAFSLNANYDANSGSASKSTISLSDKSDLSLDCLNCYIAGKAQFTLMLRGTPMSIDYYNLNLLGDLKANMDLKLDILKSTPVEKSQENVLYSIPQHPLRYCWLTLVFLEFSVLEVSSLSKASSTIPQTFLAS